MRYESPVEALKNLVVVDSPGINSTSEALLQATYNLVPKCDAAIFVTKGGQLSTSEEEFLRNGILGEGLSSVLVVVNHFDTLTPLSDEGRHRHIQALRQRLTSLGRGHLPVAMVDAKAWLDAQKAPGGELPADIAPFQETLRDFIKGNMAQARFQKALHVLRREIRAAMVELSAASSLAQSTAEERARLTQELECKSIEATQRIGRLTEDFSADLHRSLTTLRQDVGKGIEDASDVFKERLRATPDLSALNYELKRMGQRLGPEAQQRCVEAFKTFRSEFKDLETRFGRDVRIALAGLDSQNIVPTHLVRVSLPAIPGPVVTLLDYILVIIVSPLPGVLDILLRFIAERMPELRRLMPTNVAKSFAQDWVFKKMDTQIAVVFDELEVKFSQIETEIIHTLRGRASRLVEIETDPIRQALSSADGRELRWQSADITRFSEKLNSLHQQANLLAR